MRLEDEFLSLPIMLLKVHCSGLYGDVGSIFPDTIDNAGKGYWKKRNQSENVKHEIKVISSQPSKCSKTTRMECILIIKKTFSKLCYNSSK